MWLTDLREVNTRGIVYALFRYRFRRAEKNYRHNLAVFSGYDSQRINGQGTEPMCRMIYGTMPLSWNGCELISVCNAMNMLGRNVALPQVILEFELNRMHYVFPSGYWGTAPKKLGRYFDHHGVAYEKHRSAENFTKAWDSFTCGIVSFWNNKRSESALHGLDFFSGGIHTVAFESSKNGILVYDYYNNDRRPRSFRSVQEVYEDRRFIVGYVFAKHK